MSKESDAATETKPLLDKVGWTVNAKGETGLSVIDPPAFKKLRRKELSPSMSFALDNCAASMAAGRLLPRDEAPFQDNSLGTAAHAVEEILYALDGPERTKERAREIARELLTNEALMEEFIGKPLGPMIYALSDEDKERWLEEVERRALGVWFIEDPTTVNVHANELAIGGWDFKSKKPFDLKAMINGVGFVGRIDRTDVVHDESGEKVVGYRVVDYKFGHFKEASERFGDDYGDQIRQYKDAVEGALGLPVVEGHLYFCTDGKARKIDLSDDAMRRTRARYKRAANKMNKYADENFWPTAVGPLCSWCPIVNACPAAQKAGKKDLSNTEKVKGVRKVVEGKPLKGHSVVALGIPTIGAIPKTEDPTIEGKSKAKTAPSSNRSRAATGTPAAKPATAATHTATGTTTKAAKAVGAKPAAGSPAAASTSALRDGSSTARGRGEQLTGGAAHRNRDEEIEVLELTGIDPDTRAALSAYGITQIAVEQLSAAGQDVTGPTVRGLSFTLATVIQKAQERMGSDFSWSSEDTARLRSALQTTVDTLPLPWDLYANDWEAWVESASKRCSAIANTAKKLIDADTIPAEPWMALAR